MMLRHASIAIFVLGCGGKVVIDQRPAGSGGTPASSTNSTTFSTSTTPQVTVGSGGGIVSVGGVGGGVVAVGAGGFSGTGGFGTGGFSDTGGFGTSSNGGFGMGGFPGTGGTSPISCSEVACSEDSQGDCTCTGKCDGEKIKVSCGTDPGIECQCFVNGMFVGHCTPASTGQCEPEQSCCAGFF